MYGFGSWGIDYDIDRSHPSKKSSNHPDLECWWISGCLWCPCNYWYAAGYFD